MKNDRSILTPVLFCLGSLALYFPNLWRTFASDDFEVIGRIAWEHCLSVPGTFRPLAELSLLFNYLVGGWNAAGYYLFNIVVHGVNGWLIYRFCIRWGWRGTGAEEWSLTGAGRKEYAVLASLFFLVYPFHSEGIDWILGRGASLCTLFGLAALLISVGGLPIRRRFFWSGLCYFLGMAAYEPVVLLPVFGLIVLNIHGAGRRELVRWGLVMSGVFVLHLVVRVAVSGALIGPYGEGFYRGGIGWVAGNVLKTGGRLFLPPSDHPGLQTALFAGVAVAMAGVVYLFLKRTERGSAYRRYLFALVMLLGIACLMPVITGVSTRTTETDRLLYLPSVFLCCILAFFLVMLVKSVGWRRGLAGIGLLYMGFFVVKTGANWTGADAITKDILGVTGRAGAGRIFVINLPDEQDGAYIFRHGFPEAWRLWHGAGPGPVVVNHLTRDEMPGLPERLWVVRKGSARYLPPKVSMMVPGRDSGVLQLEAKPEWRVGGQDKVFYWDGANLVQVLPVAR